MSSATPEMPGEENSWRKHLSLLRPEDGEAFGVGFDAIERPAGGDVQGRAVLAAEDAVGGHFRHGQEGDLLARRAEDVDAARLSSACRRENVPRFIDAHAI